MGARQGERQRDSGDADGDNKKPKFGRRTSAFPERLAATYSRGVYKTTTIGKTVFDGRVRNGMWSYLGRSRQARRRKRRGGGYGRSRIDRPAGARLRQPQNEHRSGIRLGLCRQWQLRRPD